MVDKVYPLKYENTASGGSTVDTDPTEMRPIEDALVAKEYQVVADEANPKHQVVQQGMRTDESNNLVLFDRISGPCTLASFLQWQDMLDQDDFLSNSDLHAATQQSIKAYIDWAVNNAEGKIVYPFYASYGANATAGRYLELFPSRSMDGAPLHIPAASELVTAILSAEATSTCTFGFYNMAAPATPLFTLSLTASTSVTLQGMAHAISAGTYLAVKIDSGTATKPYITCWIRTL